METITKSLDIMTLITGLITGGVFVAIIQHIFTRKRTLAEAEKASAEAKKASAEAEKITVETERIRAEVQMVRDIQIVGEVVFNRDDPNSELYWIDENGLAHLISDKEAALLFSSHKGLIGLSAQQYEMIKYGIPLPKISKDSFRRVKGDYFLIIEGKVFYLTSLSYLYRFWDDSRQVPEIEIGEFRKLQVKR